MQAEQLECKQCSGKMKKTSRADRNYPLQIVGVVLFIAGAVIAFAFPPFSFVVGIIIMFIAAMLGYKKEKVWACNNCGYYFKRT